jgi:hypothetical protein
VRPDDYHYYSNCTTSSSTSKTHIGVYHQRSLQHSVHLMAHPYRRRYMSEKRCPWRRIFSTTILNTCGKSITMAMSITFHSLHDGVCRQANFTLLSRPYPSHGTCSRARITASHPANALLTTMCTSCCNTQPSDSTTMLLLIGGLYAPSVDRIRPPKREQVQFLFLSLWLLCSCSTQHQKEGGF